MAGFLRLLGSSKLPCCASPGATSALTLAMTTLGAAACGPGALVLQTPLLGSSCLSCLSCLLAASRSLRKHAATAGCSLPSHTAGSMLTLAAAIAVVGLHGVPTLCIAGLFEKLLEQLLLLLQLSREPASMALVVCGKLLLLLLLLLVLLLLLLLLLVPGVWLPLLLWLPSLLMLLTLLPVLLVILLLLLLVLLTLLMTLSKLAVN